MSEPDRYPLAPFQARYRTLNARGELTLEGLARRLGVANGSGAARTLGLVKDHGKPPHKHCRYETAVRLCRALDMDYVDVGV